MKTKRRRGYKNCRSLDVTVDVTLLVLPNTAYDISFSHRTKADLCIYNKAGLFLYNILIRGVFSCCCITQSPRDTGHRFALTSNFKIITAHCLMFWKPGGRLQKKTWKARMKKRMRWWWWWSLPQRAGDIPGNCVLTDALSIIASRCTLKWVGEKH